MNSKRPLYETPVPSAEFTTEAYFDDTGVEPAIRFGYKKDASEQRAGIMFKKVLAFRSRAERCCTPWHIEGAYDTLVEVENSAWVEELRSNLSGPWKDAWETHHYMIYLDSVGSFEVIAESWAPIPSEVCTRP
jgi:hypothetical protein